MSWDPTTPADTESVRNGASRIREFKTDVATALTTEGVFPGPTPSAPIFRYTPGYGATGGRPVSPSTGQLYVNTTLAVIERYNGVSWDAIATLTPVGTIAVFFQAAAPTGWTQVTSQNDAALRVVSAAGGGTGGTDSFSTGYPTHTHTMGAAGFSYGGGAFSSLAMTANPETSSGPSVGWVPKYINVILCSKT